MFQSSVLSDGYKHWPAEGGILGVSDKPLLGIVTFG